MRVSWNTEEYAAWVAGCQQRLFRSAYLLTGDRASAEDLVQEALVAVGVRWSRLRDGNPTAYARTVLARAHVSRWRRLRREILHAGPTAEVAASEEHEDRLVVMKALARLTPAQRAVVVLRHVEDLTERETAEALRVSVGTVKSQNAAALARLRSGAPELLVLRGRTS